MYKFDRIISKQYKNSPQTILPTRSEDQNDNSSLSTSDDFSLADLNIHPPNSNPAPIQTKDSIGQSPENKQPLEEKLANSSNNGNPLPDEVQTSIGSHLGHDFKDVKVHTDNNAVEMNQSLQAQAFTHGNDIYFGEGKYDPNSKEGKHLLAHELTHVVQQKGDKNLHTKLIQRKGMGWFKNLFKRKNKNEPALTKEEKQIRKDIAQLKNLPGWKKMNPEDQTILDNLIEGRNNNLSKRFWNHYKTIKSDLESKKDVEQAQILTELIGSKNILPNVVNEPVTTDKVKYTLEGPTVEKDYAFQGKKADAEKWIVKFEDGITLPIIAPKAPESGYHNHTVQETADASSYLPKANRSVMTAIVLNVVVNPNDSYWAVEYKTPDFHSYMTAGKSGVVTIYPDQDTKPLSNANYMRGTMIHETGHTWSYKQWGTDTTKGKWLEWKDAMQKDKVSVSQYGTASISEDVAETIQVYVSTEGSPRFEEYKKIVPNRFKMLDEEYKS